jgi:hypothetical protein
MLTSVRFALQMWSDRRRNLCPAHTRGQDHQRVTEIDHAIEVGTGNIGSIGRKTGQENVEFR